MLSHQKKERHQRLVTLCPKNTGQTVVNEKTTNVFKFMALKSTMGFPCGRVVKKPPANAEDAGDVGLIPGLGRSSRVGNDNPLQHSCLENSMDRGIWGCEELDMTEHTRSTQNQQ